MESCIYEGRVTHVRRAPPHRMRMRLFAFYLDLAELDAGIDIGALFSTRRPAPLRLRREDYPGHPGEPLDATIRDLVERSSRKRPAGPIRLLTQPRVLGHGFNPVSFFYCFDARGRALEAVVADVANTPWGERHCYVLDTDGAPGSVLRARARKRFHVSPFLPMDLVHEFTFVVPTERLSVGIADVREGECVFEATLAMRRRPLSSTALARILLSYPFASVQVLARIYWHALRLHRKGAPFFPSPGASSAARGT